LTCISDGDVCICAIRKAQSSERRSRKDGFEACLGIDLPDPSFRFLFGEKPAVSAERKSGLEAARV
jgi:hypothetical protein